MKRRLITTIIAVLAAVACAFVFAACSSYKSADNHPADTYYAGALSAETYASPELAAKAFIDGEVSGEVTAATFVSYTKTADLTEEEVEALDIPAAEKAEISSVEKGEVKYTVASNASVLTSASDEKQYIVIIVKYNNQTVKYYSPVLNTGDPLTKSYYDQVFSPDNFKNVTLKYKLDVPVTGTYMGITIKTKTSIKIDAKWDEDTYGYVKTETVLDLGSLGSIMGEGKKTIVTEQLYVNDKTSRFYECSFSRVTSEGETSEWAITGRPKDPDWSFDVDDGNNESGDDESNEDEDWDYDWDYDWDDDWDFGDDEDDDVLSKFLPAFDYSYFVKTKTGFKINSEKLSEYLDIVLKDAFEQIGMTEDLEIGKPSATANYYVSDGKITESVVSVVCKYTLKLDGGNAKYTMKEKITVKYSDYGTTVVNVPADLDFDSCL